MKKLILILSVMVGLLSANAWATPVGSSTLITSIRTVDTSTYIQVESGSLCNTNVFWLVYQKWGQIYLSTS